MNGVRMLRGRKDHDRSLAVLRAVMRVLRRKVDSAHRDAGRNAIGDQAAPTDGVEGLDGMGPCGERDTRIGARPDGGRADNEADER